MPFYFSFVNDIFRVLVVFDCFLRKVSIMEKENYSAVISNRGTLECHKTEIPELKDNEVLVKTHASLISPGTEMNGVKHLRQNPQEKEDYFKFGYSCAGEIIAVKGDVKNLKPGMRVACMGLTSTHSSYNAVPCNLAVPLPDNVSYEEGCFASLAATSLQAVRRSDVQLGEYGVVLGLGIVGNIAAQLYHIAGARTLAWEALPLRRKIAKKCGVQSINFMRTNAVEKSKEFAFPYGMDFALMAFGGDGSKAFESVKNVMKVSADGHQMGRVVVVGGCSLTFTGGAVSGNLDVRASSRTGAGYHDKDWEYGKDYPDVFVQFTTTRNVRELLQLIAEKRLKVMPLITHTMRVQDIAEAGEMLIDHPDKTLGIILKYDGEK